MAPKIDRKNLQKKKIKIGEPLKFEADVKGEPEPTITWTFNGSALKPEERSLYICTIIDYADFCKLSLIDYQFLIRNLTFVC